MSTTDIPALPRRRRLANRRPLDAGRRVRRVGGGLGERLALDTPGAKLSYDALATATRALADRLRDGGVGPGDRVGVRVASGTAELYVAILGVLAAGAAYVPVDADDPAARAEQIFTDAGVCAAVGDALRADVARRARRAEPAARVPTTTPGSSSPPARRARRRASP